MKICRSSEAVEVSITSRQIPESIFENRVPLLSELSVAERLVAAHLLNGLSAKEIATSLGKSISTIKNQTSAIFRKTGTSSRARFTALYYLQCHARSTVSSRFGPSASVSATSR
ncbi:helix-turn-helix transcriptional regulator [Oleiharenicola lentus]|uniref:helix-turn-helix transcriptional regulator n=1 Tax=Oleiharenicola lentus TaxID=2508720 RepID=UPI003F6668DE